MKRLTTILSILILAACGGGGGGGSSPAVNDSPIASAGANQSVVTNTVVTLDGSKSSDANNDSLTYAWTLTTKPNGSSAILTSSTSPKANFTPDLAGTYTATLVVNDGKVSSVANTVSITAAVENAAPIANAGLAQNVTVGTTVTVDGSASSDANGDQLTYAWTLTAKPAGSMAGLSSITTAKPTLGIDVAGSYVASLVVNDGKVNSTNAATVTIVATVANAAPVANAGVAQNVVAGSVVVLDGSSSSDANSDPLTYAWALTSKPAGSAAVLSSPTSAKPTFTADLSGIYVATLIVNDGKVSSSKATVTISANALNQSGAGKVITKIGENSYGRAVLTQTDGKIVVAGVSTASLNPDITVVRYNLNGSLDTTFGGTGVVLTNVAGRLRSDEWVRSAAIQSDGKIIVAGYTATSTVPGYSIALVRYNSDGTLDSSFGVNGIVTTSHSIVNLYGNSVAIQSDGKILVAGSANLENRSTPGLGTLLIRYNANGSMDTSFGRQGLIIDASTLGVQGAVLQADGKIVVAGAKPYNGSSTSNVFALARYDSVGNLDAGFGVAGTVTTEIGTEIGSSDSGNAVTLQADGKILVAGVTYSSKTKNDFALVRYQSNGSIDTSFGIGGKVTTDFEKESDIAYAVAVQPDGKILVAGDRTSVRSNPQVFPGFYSSANYDFAVVRYNSNGSLDTGFGTSGKVITDFGLLTDNIYAVAIQVDGSILVSGSSQVFASGDAYSVFATARYISNGSLDSNFGNR